MTPTLSDYGIDRLNTDDRIALAVAIWDSIPTAPPLTPEQCLHSETRRSEHHADPSDVVPWDEVAAEADTRWTT